MGMQEMREPAVVMPDTYGLPVYRVNRCIKQRVGEEIHILMGQEIFGQTVWSHIEVWSVADVLIHSQEFNEMARDAVREDRAGAH